VVDGGGTLDVSNVIWCTGFREDFSWIDDSLLGDGGQPQHRRGVSTSAPGLFFLGQEFLFAATSATLPGVCRDAQYLAAQLPPTSGTGLSRAAVSSGAGRKPTEVN